MILHSFASFIVSCPSGYEEGPKGHCYRFREHDTGFWWVSGRRGCDDVEHSDLLVISDQEEWQFVMNRTAEINPNISWWIGNVFVPFSSLFLQAFDALYTTNEWDPM